LRYNLDGVLYGYGTAIVHLMLLHHVQMVNLIRSWSVCSYFSCLYHICRLSCIVSVWDTFLVFCYYLSCVHHVV